VRIVALLAMALLGAGFCGCGSKRAGDQRTEGQKTKTLQQRLPAGDSGPTDSDADRDGYVGRLYDRDDAWAFHYGRPATAPTERVVTSLVLRYYAAASAGDGASACPLVYSLIAENLAEERGHVLGPSGLPSATCAQVLSGLFREQHRRLARVAAVIRVVGVRVGGALALALLNTGDEPLRHIWLHREGGAWKVKEFWDDGMQ
jgi:hypothetical protein